jgi:tetratricopeptide (TPR) repeat protein
VRLFQQYNQNEEGVKMKRAFVIITVLAIILSLSYGLLVAQEPEKEQEVREGNEARRVERRPDMDRRMEQEERMRDRPEAIYDRLFAELRRQRDEIRALREEVAALRRMLEDQFAVRRARQVRRGRELLRRWEEPEREPERGDFRERWEPERTEIPDDIDREIRDTREKLERHPDDIEVRMRLAHLYREVDKIEAAIEQYKAILKIAPDFDPPYQALKELGYRFPDAPRDEDVALKDSMGEVISSSEKEVKVKTLEGDVVTFTVPSWQRDDGSWTLNEDISEMTKSLDPGAQVKIFWREHEGLRVIQRMEKIEKGDVER